MFPIWLIAVLSAAGAIVFVTVCYCALFKVFVNSRRNVVKVLSNLKYMPEVIVEKEVYVEVQKKLTKRQLRRKNMRELDRELRLKYEEQKNKDSESDEEDGLQYEQEHELPKGVSAKVISWVSSTFSTKSGKVGDADIEMGKLKRKRSSKMNGFSSKSESFDSEGEMEVDGSTKSKRFISINRLQRQLTRMGLVKPKQAVVEEAPEEEEEPDFDNVVSLLSLAHAKKKRITEIMENRKSRKEKDTTSRAVVDVVALNAGPPMELIPKGYELVSQSLGAALISPELLIYKRILYLWDGSVGNIKGWYPGTVVGISENAGFNFRVKYDRAETKSIFVDGIQPVFLSLSGENAFGRRWVAMQKSEASGTVEI